MTTDRNNNEEKRYAGMSRATRVISFIISLLGAVLLWIYAIGYDSTLFERNFSGVEVVIQGEEMLSELTGFTLAEKQDFSSITVVAKGKRSVLNALSASDFRAVVDVSKALKAGNQTLDITVYSPNGVEVVSQSSTTVEVFVDEFTQRSDLLTVSVDTGDNYVMHEGVTFVSAMANPMSVTVSGPKSVLDKIDGAFVKFNLDGHVISDNITGYGAIELRDAKGNVISNPYVSISDNTAYVTVVVTKQKTVPVRVVLTGGVYNVNDIATTVSAQSVTLSGEPELLAAINELVLEIDETEIDGTQVFEFSIGSMLPSGVTNASGYSKISVTVTMPELSVRNYTINKDRIVIENLPEGYTYEVKDSIVATLIGPRDAFAEFDSNLLTATVNFDRITIEADGSYTALAKINLGAKYESIYAQSKDYTVGFTITAPITLPDDLTGVGN